MTYLIQTHISSDPIIILRIAACAAGIGVSDPRFWAQENVIRIATNDGWAAAYKGSTSDDPGADETAITDQMILAAVEALWASQQPPEPAPEEPEDPAQ